MSISIAENKDCMEALKGFPDKYFELAIVDPPYGIGGSRAVGTYARKYTKYSAANDKGWDKSIPNKEYFDELYRVSQNQVIWGANYMVEYLKSSKGWVCWYKTDELKGRDFSECEFAYTSFDCRARHIELRPFVKGGSRIHPTQKPVELYKEVLRMFAKPDDKILDTHSGSGSLRIACYDMNFDSWNYELDKEYFDAQEERFQYHIKQERIVFE